MRKMVGKKGLSQVVTVVLIILVVLAAIVIIWASVRPTIEGVSEQITADCVTLELEVVDCVGSSGSTTVDVKRQGSGDLTDVILVFSDGTTFDSTGGSIDAPSPLETVTYTISGTDYTDKTVNVAAIVGQGNICSESSKAAFTCT